MATMIMGVKVEHRHAEAKDVQSVLTEYGCFIKTRLGLHNASDDREVCSENGLILIEFIENCKDEVHELTTKLEKLQGVHVRLMIF